MVHTLDAIRGVAGPSYTILRDMVTVEVRPGSRYSVEATATIRHMTTHIEPALKVGDPVKLRDSDMDLRGDVWQLRTGAYVVVRWEDQCRTTHSHAAIELDRSRGRADWSRKVAHQDR